MFVLISINENKIEEFESAFKGSGIRFEVLKAEKPELRSDDICEIAKIALAAVFAISQMSSDLSSGFSAFRTSNLMPEPLKADSNSSILFSLMLIRTNIFSSLFTFLHKIALDVKLL